jgi:hypothetical protein
MHQFAIENFKGNTVEINYEHNETAKKRIYYGPRPVSFNVGVVRFFSDTPGKYIRWQT